MAREPGVTEQTLSVPEGLQDKFSTLCLCVHASLLCTEGHTYGTSIHSSLLGCRQEAISILNLLLSSSVQQFSQTEKVLM